VAGFIKGMGHGLVGAVAAPVVGTLGAVSRVTEGVDASTSYYQQRRKYKTATRRARVAGPDGTLPCLEGDARIPTTFPIEHDDVDLDEEEEYDEETMTSPTR